MSETVHYKGKLRLAFSYTNKIQAICDKFGLNYKEDDDIATIEDNLRDYGFLKYKDEWYLADKDEVSNNDDIYEINDNLEFEVKYYNGGCDFDEAIEKALKSRDKS